MSSDRLQNLADSIRLQTKVLDAYEKDLIQAMTQGDRAKLSMRLQKEKELLANFQEEFYSLLPQEEEKAIAEIIEALPSVQTNSELPPELVAWMQKIYEEVSKPTPNAAAKLKPFLSLTPPFFGIIFEGEFDLEGTIQKYLPTFVRLGSAIRRLPAKK